MSSFKIAAATRIVYKEKFRLRRDLYLQEKNAIKKVIDYYFAGLNDYESEEIAARCLQSIFRDL